MGNVGQLIAQRPEIKATHHIIPTAWNIRFMLVIRVIKLLRNQVGMQSTARGGLLHIMFYYDWRETKPIKPSWVHPQLAVRNVTS